MNPGKAPLWISAQDSSTFMALVCRQLEAGGYTVVRSFDLQTGQPSQEFRSALQDVQPGCACRMVILLVYGSSGAPVSLTLMNHGEKTFLYLNDDSSDSAAACSCTSIASLLSSSLEAYDSIDS